MIHKVLCMGILFSVILPNNYTVFPLVILITVIEGLGTIGWMLKRLLRCTGVQCTSNFYYKRQALDFGVSWQICNNVR